MLARAKNQPQSIWVDGICRSGQSGTVKNRGVENAGADISARYGKGGQCGRRKRAQVSLT